MDKSSKERPSKTRLQGLICIGLLALNLGGSDALASPFPTFNQPVSINWWKASCVQGYAVPENTYAKGYCDGVIDASLNNLERWCVPEDVTWGEVKRLLIRNIKEANLKQPISSLSIVKWIDGALNTKWPCGQSEGSSVVTDPELIKKLNALRREQELRFEADSEH